MYNFGNVERFYQSMLFLFSTAYLPARDLAFSRVTSNSFNINWSPAGAGVLSYLVKYKVAIGEEEFIVSVPAPVTTTVLTNLLPQTTYAVSVIAEYEDGDGASLDGEETTLEGSSVFGELIFIPEHSPHGPGYASPGHGAGCACGWGRRRFQIWVASSL